MAGLAAAAALGSAGFKVNLFESRAFLGGRATSFPVSPGDDNSELIDNCQHEELAAACADLKRWEFLVTIAPLKLPNSTGCPVNPIVLL